MTSISDSKSKLPTSTSTTTTKPISWAAMAVSNMSPSISNAIDNSCVIDFSRVLFYNTLKPELEENNKRQAIYRAIYRNATFTCCVCELELKCTMLCEDCQRIISDKSRYGSTLVFPKTGYCCASCEAPKYTYVYPTKR
jgi:hypothetical protein